MNVRSVCDIKRVLCLVFESEPNVHIVIMKAEYKLTYQFHQGQGTRQHCIVCDPGIQAKGMKHVETQSNVLILTLNRCKKQT